MSKGKTLLIHNYVVLLFWWIILRYISDSQGIGNTFFSLGVGLYALVMGISLSLSVYRYENYLPQRMAIVLISLGMSLFGIGCIFWFYYDIVFGLHVPFPSFADLFYMLQPILTVMGLMFFIKEIESTQKTFTHNSTRYILLKSMLFVCALWGFVLAAAFFYLRGSSVLDTFLLLYYPFESFSIVVLALIVYFKYLRTWTSAVNRYFLFAILGNVMWFLADSMFLYEILNTSFINAGISDLLFLTGSFLILFGLTGIVEGSKEEGFISPIEPVFFHKVTYYAEEDLN